MEQLGADIVDERAITQQAVRIGLTR